MRFSKIIFFLIVVIKNGLINSQPQMMRDEDQATELFNECYVHKTAKIVDNFFCSSKSEVRVSACEQVARLSVSDDVEDVPITVIDDFGIMGIEHYECHDRTEDQSSVTVPAIYCPPSNVEVDGMKIRAAGKFVSDGEDQNSAFVFDVLENGNIAVVDYASNLNIT